MTALSRCRGVAVSRCRGVAVSRCRGVAVSRCRGVAVSRCRGLVLSRCRGVAVSRSRAVALSRCRAVAVSQCRDMGTYFGRRVVTSSPHFTSSMPCLRWLPDRYRIIFEIYTITYQALSYKQPSNLHSLLALITRMSNQLRCLRSLIPIFFMSLK